MIGRLCGIILEKQPPHLVLDVNGVGYELEASMTTFYALPEVGEKTRIYTHLTVREDTHLLFGFANEDERQLFRTLIKVNGVGVKMALTILSGIESHDFALCIQHGDTDRLVRLPGVGKKTVERLIIEMRDRLKDWQAAAINANTTADTSNPFKKDPLVEAESALISLGYKPQEASRYVNAVASEGMNSEEIIRQAFKSLIKS